MRSNFSPVARICLYPSRVPGVSAIAVVCLAISGAVAASRLQSKVGARLDGEFVAAKPVGLMVIVLVIADVRRGALPKSIFRQVAWVGLRVSFSPGRDTGRAATQCALPVGAGMGATVSLKTLDENELPTWAAGANLALGDGHTPMHRAASDDEAAAQCANEHRLSGRASCKFLQENTT